VVGRPKTRLEDLGGLGFPDLVVDTELRPRLGDITGEEPARAGPRRHGGQVVGRERLPRLDPEGANGAGDGVEAEHGDLVGVPLQVEDKVVGHGFAEIIQARVARAVDEGQDGQGEVSAVGDDVRPAVADGAPAEDADDENACEGGHDGPAFHEIQEVRLDGLALVELHVEPAVDLVLVGHDAGLGRAVEAVDGKAELLLPAAAGPDVAAEVGGDVLPGLKDLSRVHRPFPRGLSPKLFIRKGDCQAALLGGLTCFLRPSWPGKRKKQVRPLLRGLD